MTWFIPHRWTRRLARLALASLVGAVVGGAESAAASSGSIRPGDLAGAARHQCQCGTGCRGDSCCCAPRPQAQAQAQAPVARPVPQNRRIDSPLAKLASSPCFQAAPCGDPGIPTASTVIPIDRVALIGAGWPWFAVDSARLDRDPAVSRAPRTRAERIDDPPEISTAV